MDIDVYEDLTLRGFLSIWLPIKQRLLKRCQAKGISPRIQAQNCSDYCQLFRARNQPLWVEPAQHFDAYSRYVNVENPRG